VSVEELKALDERWLMPTYARAPVVFVRGEGPRLWDAGGKRYLDFFSGLSVHNLGHCHPRVVTAISEQARTLMGVSNLYLTEPGPRLAERLGGASLGGKVFLCNSGAEANECAIKLARKHARARGVERPEIVVLEGAFHGRTVATLAATPALARDDLFGPLPAGFRAVARDEPAAVREAVGEATAAVMLEPIQGEAGVFPVPLATIAAAREACDAAGALLIFDEIQTGMGRTGALWAYQGLGVRPDVLSSAKALGGGLPIGACVTTPELGDVLGRGDHGSTFGGNALAAAAALATIEAIDTPDLLGRVERLGKRLKEKLVRLEGVAEVRGRGLMIGLSLAEGRDAAEVAAGALDAGLVVNVPGPGMLRLLPPLIVGDAEIDEAVTTLEDALLA
jgi:predicted acetylornithine/succinylornithine family transaminase